MKGYFVDSNVLIHFYVEDDSSQARKAETLLRRAKAGHLELITGPPAFFETAWVLRDLKVPIPNILEFLESLLALPGLKVLDADRVRRACLLARSTNTEFADAYVAATAVELELGVVTFNLKDFKKAGSRIFEW